MRVFFFNVGNPHLFSHGKKWTCFSSQVNRLMELLHDLEERQQPSSDQAKDEEKERLKVHPPGAFVSGRLWWKVEDISGKGENYIMGPTYISWKSLI